jgi:ABC-type uncharacterized transport system substrate-binding protein
VVFCWGGISGGGDLITLTGGTAVWPFLVHAQQAERMRRVGVILPAAADDAEYQSCLGAFLQALAQLDWSIGRNLRADIHWATPDPENISKQAAELVALAPDVSVAAGTSTVGPVLQATRIIPVVFPTVVDPSAPASSTVWRGRAAMPRDSFCTNTAWEESGSNCLNASRLA